MFLAASALIVVAFLDEDTVTDIIKGKGSSSTQKSIEAQCLELRKQLVEQQLPTEFSKVDLNLIDPLPNKEIVSQTLDACLVKSPTSQVSVQGDIFSSDYEGKDGDVIIGQMSFFDSSENKIMEINLQWHTENFQASDLETSESPKSSPDPQATSLTEKEQPSLEVKKEKTR